MNVLAAPFKQLVERKLWPIALLLVAALVAVPMLLKKDASSASLPPATSTAALPSSAADTSVVSELDPAKADRTRTVLGDRKDPFRPAQVHHVKKSTDGLTTTGAPTAVNTGSTSGSSAGGATPTTPVATPTPVPEPTFDLYSLEVRFGSTASSGALTTRNVRRLTGLPGGENPAVLYLGLTDDHKSAVFIVDAGVKPIGDGDCKPTPDNCETLTLKKGQTEFLTRGTKQWELDLIGIHLSKTRSAQTAARAHAQIASAGRQKLRGMISRIGSWSYDTKKGTLHRLPKAQQARRVARAERDATFTSTG
jgi:hypothetical protein